MNASHIRFRQLFLACGVFCALPLVGSLWQFCPHPSGNECCERCRPAASLLLNSAQAQTGEPKVQPQTSALPVEAKAALDKLMEGNRRFAAGKPSNKHTSLEWRVQIAKEQKPFATI